ncbi:MAG: M23 family metallopeptidase [Desulfitobacterium hafniense]|nr:M23 family metallopeptidase [Desulfitobacterium hafniense]
MIALLAWKMLHSKPQIPEDIYPYLTSLEPDLVLSVQTEGLSLRPNAWIDILAIRSTLSEKELAPIIHQVYNNIHFDKINWGTIDQNKVKSINRKRDILQNFPYFEPGRFTFPVKGKTWYDNTFGADREGGKRRHEGTDLFGPEGTPIVSVCSGRVEQLGWNRLGGERVGIRGDDGNYYYYAHLYSIEPSLKVGQTISQNTLIGTMGHTGDALTTPDHLHFGIELPNGQWINPYPLLKVWHNQGFLAP